MSLTQHWKLDETSGTNATATVGNAGTYARDASNTTSATGPGTAITKSQDFNGTSDSVNISAASLSFASGSAFSISGWLKFDGSSGALCGSSGTNSNRFAKSTDTAIQVIGSSTTRTFTVSSLGTTLWRHLLVTRTTGNSVRVFVDGVESSTGSQALAETFAPGFLGRTNANFLDGKIAWVKVFNTDESANVAALFAEKDGAVPVFMNQYRQRRG